MSSEFGGRTRQEREEIEKDRYDYALRKLSKLGMPIKPVNKSRIDIKFRGNIIQFFPYTGWHSGKGIKDGRGFKKLYNQLTGNDNKKA